MPKIVVLGEALIDLFADPGKGLGDMPRLRPSPGGAPANVAVALGRLGAEVGFIGKVGADAFGQLLQTTLKKHGVDTRYFVADRAAPTMLGLVALPHPNEQQFVLYNGANELLDATSLPREYIQGAGVFVYGSVTLAGRAGTAALKAAEIARGANRQVIFDVNLRPALWPDLDDAKTQIETALATATVIKVNETELEFLSGTRDLLQGSQYLLRKGASLCLVSQGQNGAFFSNGKAMGQVAAFAVEVQNTVGCGDAFVAGLALKLSELQVPLKGLGVGELCPIIHFANACGAIVATQEGAMTAELSMSRVEALIQQRS